MVIHASAVIPITKTWLLAELGRGAATNYLFKYLRALGAKTAYVEPHYVDRHFLDDYAGYYSFSFEPPQPFCKRIHFFTLTKAELEARLSEGCSSVEARSAAETLLLEPYLGFLVRRPLGDAAIGRTVLKTYPDVGRRRYTAVRRYEANVAGLRLSLNGIAFQQQDGQVAVCASTALWMALQRVSEMNGNRSPTPSAVTRAAQSPFPTADGLRLDQMATALATLGYIADYFAPANNRRLFRTKVGACLRSGLPVILLLERNRYQHGKAKEGHAVTVTGYSDPLPPIPVDVEARPPENIDPIPMGSGSLNEIYVHDDNLGSHLHYKLLDDDQANDDGYEKLLLQRGKGDDPIPEWTVDQWEVCGALVPKPEWHRLPVHKLVDEIVSFRPFLELVRANLHYEVRFVSGVDFKRGLIGGPYQPDELSNFLRSLSLPRYVGLVECFSGNDELCSIAIDVSEAKQGDLPTVLAFVAPGIRDDYEREQITKLCDPDGENWPLLVRGH